MARWDWHVRLGPHYIYYKVLSTYITRSLIDQFHVTRSTSIISIIVITNIIRTQTKQSEMHAIKANIQCHCGEVKGIVDSPSALRLVCYCRDCRGYYSESSIIHVNSLHIVLRLAIHLDWKNIPTNLHCVDTLNNNNMATKMGLPEPPAKLDPFGGADFTQIYPSEIKIVEGQDQLETCIIRKISPIHRTYAKCCYSELDIIAILWVVPFELVLICTILYLIFTWQFHL